MIELSDKVKEWFNNNWPEVEDIDKLSLEELKVLRDDVVAKRGALETTELATKTLGNAGYGACGNPGFYFYNTDLAGDITAECRHLTKFMIDKGEEFFHKEIWERKDLWEKFDIDLDESKKEWLSTRPIWIYSDTDSTSFSSKLLLLNKITSTEIQITISELYDKIKTQSYLSNQKHEIKDVNGEFSCLNYKDGEVTYSPIRRVIRHKVSKPKFKIKTKSGKEIIVTGDHSCVVFRNGEQLAIKAKDINIKTDKILTICD